MKKKPTKSFREYAIKWREQAARVKPPMDNHELITIFLEAQEPDYFQNMMSAMSRPFAEAIKIGEMVKNGLKTDRILRKTPAQISLLSLIIHSEEHAHVLIKILNKAYISEKTTVNQLEKMTNRCFEVNRIFFVDDELPDDGAGHNRALHLIVKCEGHYVKRVMVDGGSSVDVCPLSTLHSMKINTDKIRPSNVHIRAFDGSARDTIGEINLTMTIGPVDFEIVFQILKFEHDRQEIIVHGEDESSIYKDPLIPCIEAKKGCESIVYQDFKVVIVDHVEEGKPILHPRLSATSVMVVALMMRQGYEPGNDLRTSMQGISKPISLGLSADLVVHKLPKYPDFPPIQQKQRKFKTDMSDKIKEEIMKQLSANVVRAVRYTTWVANFVPVPKKDEKTRVCIDYRDLNKASSKDNFPLPNIHILVDNCAKHEIQSFVDCYVGVMPFSLKNVGATYKRDMTTIFHDMMHKELEVYVDDVIIKSKTQADHLRDLKKFFERLRRYDLKLNPVKCTFGVLSGKLLDVIVSRRGIKLDPSKIKSIRYLPPPK
ncbi:uncharacterized protein [Nicotiana tomentosiformis]|uniref:uncharacterized protein n=1 Tax=Nicotiana tomentosiformis TaxID=4098 RepID=UPI00388C7077